MTKKLFWENAYKTTFTAEVISVNEDGIILNQTLFYPESGNQASDTGYLKIKENNFKVEKVTKEAENILHQISSDFKNKINIGDKVEGEIDWNHRYGVMKAHTSQHIFSAVIKSKYNIDTVRAILNFEEVFLQISHELDYEQLKKVLTEVNKICTIENLKVDTKIISYKQAEKISKKIRSAIPDESQVRLIEVEDLDMVCCGGTHVINTTEIGNIFIYEFKKGTEIRYVVGDKAVEMSSNIDLDLLALANSINSPLAKLKTLLKKRLDLIETIQEQQKDLSIKLLDAISKSPLKIIDNLSLFYIDFNVDIKILNKSLENFPSNSLIIVKFEGNKLRLISLNEKIDCNSLLQKLIQKYGGKGGGNLKSSQAFLEEMPENIIFEIETLILNNKNKGL